MNRRKMSYVLTSLLTITGLMHSDTIHSWANEWTAGDGQWSNPANWLDNSVPGSGNLAFVGLLSENVENSLVQVDQPVFVEDLRIGNGMEVVNRVLPAGDAFPITVHALLTVEDVNQVEPGPDFHSRLLLYRSPALFDLDAQNVRVSSGGELELRNGAIANIGFALTMGANGTLAGQGIVNLLSADLRNRGTIDAKGLLTITQTGGGILDLDGDLADNGQLWIGGSSVPNDAGVTVRDHLTVSSTGLTDSFSGTILLSNDRHMTMILSEGWTADSESSISFGIDGATNQPATINGSHVTLEGEVNLIAPQVEFERAAARFNSDATINPSATFSLGTDAQLQFHGTTTINGGEFTLAHGFTDLHFFGPTTLRGGVFSTHSDSYDDGQVTFRDLTEWDGEVTINGVARQMDDATVSGTTVINAVRFDMDGVPGSPFQADWDVNSVLTVNADNIDLDDGNTFGATMSIAGGFASRLNINLADPDEFWTMAGTLDLNNNLPFGATRLAGSKIWLLGELNVSGADIRIDADTRLASGSITNFADSASSLGMQKKTDLDAGAIFVGEGTLINRSTGEVNLADGATLDETGFINEGLFTIADSPGIASVDSFENTSSGTWVVEIGGHLTGDEHDLLQVTDMDTLLDGLLSVELIAGGSDLFLPKIGDEFLVLTSVGNVVGTFDNEPTSVAAGKEFQWEVLYHPHDVTLRLVAIENIVPEPAGWLLLSLAATSILLRRK